MRGIERQFSGLEFLLYKCDNLSMNTHTDLQSKPWPKHIGRQKQDFWGLVAASLSPSSVTVLSQGNKLENDSVVHTTSTSGLHKNA